MGGCSRCIRSCLNFLAFFMFFNEPQMSAYKRSVLSFLKDHSGGFLACFSSLTTNWVYFTDWQVFRWTSSLVWVHFSILVYQKVHFLKGLLLQCGNVAKNRPFGGEIKKNHSSADEKIDSCLAAILSPKPPNVEQQSERVKISLFPFCQFPTEVSNNKSRNCPKI